MSGAANLGSPLLRRIHYGFIDADREKDRPVLAVLAFAEFRPAEVRHAEVRPAEVRPAEVRPAEVRFAEVRLAELSQLSLFIPSGRSLLQKIECFFICHSG